MGFENGRLNHAKSSARGMNKKFAMTALKRRKTATEQADEIENSPFIADSVMRLPTSKYLKNANKKVIEKLLKSRLKIKRLQTRSFE